MMQAKPVHGKLPVFNSFDELLQSGLMTGVEMVVPPQGKAIRVEIAVESVQAPRPLRLKFLWVALMLCGFPLYLLATKICRQSLPGVALKRTLRMPDGTALELSCSELAVGENFVLDFCGALPGTELTIPAMRRAILEHVAASKASQN